VAMMVWAVDIGDYTRALTLARYVIRHDLRMPEGFERGAACWLLEELAKTADLDAEALPALAEALDLTAGKDMPDQARAKAHRALGLAAESDDPAGAVRHLETALRLDPGCGVKRALVRVRAAAETAGTDTAENPA